MINMCSKRKSVFSLPSDSEKKKAKVNINARLSRLTLTSWKYNDDLQLAKDSIPSTHSPQSKENNFVLLRTLLQDIIQSHGDTQSHGSQTDTDIFTAATELDAALQRAAGTIKSTTKPYEGATLALETSEANVECSLPPLPPILDDMLERAVFTHPGVSNNSGATYDRLEVLGDAYIELISTKLIWDRFQDIPSGQISQIRERLVKNETLSDYASKYGLDSRASVPPDYRKQPKRWLKTKADIFEAYVAAVVLSDTSNGYCVAEEWLRQLWSPKLEKLEKPKSALHAKEALAKKIMGKGIKLNYIDERPPAQRGRGLQTYFIGVYLTGWGWNHKHLGSGQGSNKAIAGNEAAEQALLNEPLIEKIMEVKKAHLAQR
ncbi:RNase3 domain protein [Aspergillus niger]|nr:RNase3 domain protein [Aspergillus niger]